MVSNPSWYTHCGSAVHGMNVKWKFDPETIGTTVTNYLSMQVTTFLYADLNLFSTYSGAFYPIPSTGYADKNLFSTTSTACGGPTAT
jgi:hypothetical protein